MVKIMKFILKQSFLFTINALLETDFCRWSNVLRTNTLNFGVVAGYKNFNVDYSESVTIFRYIRILNKRDKIII